MQAVAACALLGTGVGTAGAQVEEPTLESAVGEAMDARHAQRAQEDYGVSAQPTPLRGGGRGGWHGVSGP